MLYIHSFCNACHVPLIFIFLYVININTSVGSYLWNSLLSFSLLLFGINIFLLIVYIYFQSLFFCRNERLSSTPMQRTCKLLFILYCFINYKKVNYSELNGTTFLKFFLNFIMDLNLLLLPRIYRGDSESICRFCTCCRSNLDCEQLIVLKLVSWHFETLLEVTVNLVCQLDLDCEHSCTAVILPKGGTKGCGSFFYGWRTCITSPKHVWVDWNV
jgi:hypothetical protein